MVLAIPVVDDDSVVVNIGGWSAVHVNLDRDVPSGLKHLPDVDDDVLVTAPVLFVLPSDGRLTVQWPIAGSLEGHIFGDKGQEPVEVLAIVSLDVMASEGNGRRHMSSFLPGI
jgi:hypothetical protein